MPHTYTFSKINSSYYLEKGIEKSILEKRRQQLNDTRPVEMAIRIAVLRVLEMVIWPFSTICHIGKRIALVPLKFLLFGLLFMAEITLRVINMRLPKYLLNAVALKDLSTAGMYFQRRIG